MLLFRHLRPGILAQAWLVGGAPGQAEGGSRLYFKVLALGCFTYLLWPLPLLAVLAYG